MPILIILLRGNKMKIKLQEYIETAYKGKLSQFAEDAGIAKEELDKMINQCCYIDTNWGAISRCQVKHICDQWVIK